MAKTDKKETKKTSYVYRFIEMRDEMEKTATTIEKAIVQNSSIQLKLIEKGLDKEQDFKLILENLKAANKNYNEQLDGLRRRINIGNKFLELVNESNDEIITLLMDFLGVFKK